MTDTPPAQNGADATPGFRILAQFIRDLSFENPRAPNSLRGQSGAPQIEMNVEMNGRARTDDLYESDLKLTVSAKSDGETMFHIELLYGGLFQLSNFPEDEIEVVLLVECPRFLFPYARRIIADMTGEGGFPPFVLDPIDFGAVYLARRAQAEAAGAGETPGIA
jgi:preprotein translocase subunit SecB